MIKFEKKPLGSGDDEVTYIEDYSIDLEDRIDSAIGDVNAYIGELKRYGVRRALGAATAELERLGDAVGLVANADNSLTSYNTVVNNFDDIYPWSEMKNCKIASNGTVVYEGDPDYDTASGDWMVEIPKFYIKHTHDGENVEYWVSAGGGEGYDQVDKFYVGRFKTSTDYTSEPNVLPAVSIHRRDFRTNSFAKGDGWQAMDLIHNYALRVLFQVEFAHLDSQLILGRGVISTDARKEGGRTLDLIASSGTSNGTNDDCSISYRGIEDIYGNVYEWVEGCLIMDYQAYVCTDPTKYSDTLTDDYKPVGYFNSETNGYVQEMGFSPMYKFAEFPISVGATSATGYCDNYYQNAGLRAPLFGGGWTAGVHAGLFLWLLSAAPGAGSTSGSRLLKLP